MRPIVTDTALVWRTQENHRDWRCRIDFQTRKVSDQQDTYVHNRCVCSGWYIVHMKYMSKHYVDTVEMVETEGVGFISGHGFELFDSRVLII